MFIKRFLERDQTTHKHIPLEAAAQREKVVRDSNAFKEEEGRVHVPDCSVVLGVIAQGTNTALGCDQIPSVWVVNTKVWTAFFLLLSWPASKLIRSHPEETCREPHVSSTAISILLSGHKGPRLSSPPRVLKLLSDGSHPARPCDGHGRDQHPLHR